MGVFYAARKVLSHPEIAKLLGVEPGIEGKTFIIQGFGNVGYWASKFFTKDGGAKLVGVAEYDGSIYNEDGIDPDELFKYKQENKGVKNFPGCKSFDNEEAIYQQAYVCDYSATSSSPPPWRRPSTRTTPTSSQPS